MWLPSLLPRAGITQSVLAPAKMVLLLCLWHHFGYAQAKGLLEEVSPQENIVGSTGLLWEGSCRHPGKLLFRLRCRVHFCRRTQGQGVWCQQGLHQSSAEGDLQLARKTPTERGIFREECRLRHAAIAMFAQACCRRRLDTKAMMERAI